MFLIRFFSKEFEFPTYSWSLGRDEAGVPHPSVMQVNYLVEGPH